MSDPHRQAPRSRSDSSSRLRLSGGQAWASRRGKLCSAPGPADRGTAPRGPGRQRHLRRCGARARRARRRTTQRPSGPGPAGRRRSAMPGPGPGRGPCRSRTSEPGTGNAILNLNLGSGHASLSSEFFPRGRVSGVSEFYPGRVSVSVPPETPRLPVAGRYARGHAGVFFVTKECLLSPLQRLRYTIGYSSSVQDGTSDRRESRRP
jgi:hypothetical protein